MGAPVVRRDELEELRADFEKYKKANARKANAAAKDPDKAFVTREQLRAEFVKFAQALGIAPMPEDIPEDPELEDSAGKDPELDTRLDEELTSAELEERKSAPGQTPDILSGPDQDEEGAE